MLLKKHLHSFAKTGIDASILARIKSLSAKVEPLSKTVRTVSAANIEEICAECNCPMLARDTGFVCEKCGKNGSELEIHQQATHIAIQNNQSGPTINGGGTKLRTQDDHFTRTYNAALSRLSRQNPNKLDYHIPLDILRETAYSYATICHTGHKDMIVKKNKQRYNLLLTSLLQNQLDKRGLSKTDNYVCQFSGISKSKFTKSKNRLQTFIKSGAVSHVHPYDRIPSFVYLFLSKLGIDTIYTSLVVEIIRRGDVQTDMIHYRTCQDNSKVVGAIWLIARQMNIKLQYTIISEKCEHISKSTYMRYVDFIDENRRRINPILVKYRIRPIPKSFALPKVKRDANSRTLHALPEQYANMYVYMPDPPIVPKVVVLKPPTKKALALLAAAAATAAVQASSNSPAISAEIAA